MRISDWSSDVCSSDLARGGGRACRTHDFVTHRIDRTHVINDTVGEVDRQLLAARQHILYAFVRRDRKSVVEGKSVSVRVDLGGRRIIKKNILSGSNIHTTITKTIRQ